MKKTKPSLRLLDWEQPGTVVPFPSARRVGFIWRKAQMLLVRPAQLGSADHGRTREKLIRSILEREWDRLWRCGIDAASVKRELMALETALRIEMAATQGKRL